MCLTGTDQKTIKVNRGVVWAYCYPVIKLDLFLFLLCWDVTQIKTAIVQLQV